MPDIVCDASAGECVALDWCARHDSCRVSDPDGWRLDIMGFREIREHLGVSNTRVHQLKQRDDFPQPVARLAMGPVYDGAEVREWAAAYDERRLAEAREIIERGEARARRTR